MNANQIKAQLAQVFENDYCGYEYFVEKVINVIFTGDDAYEALTIPEEYLSDEKRQKAKESGILKILKVGEINTSEPIEVFDITLSDRKDLQYNRVGIQSFIRSELFMFTNAFMLFHNENPEGKDWRFSFAYKDTTIKGMTPAKRYTYLFGKNHRARTASERFAKLADAEKDTQNLLNAFSVEALSKDFFNGYKEQYKAFCDFLFAHKDDREYFGPKFSQWEDKYLRDYVKKMMGRITFIYFLQRKGWMNNDLDYMQKAFENSTCKDDYLDSFLEPLFCGVLNTKPEERAELFKSLGWNLSLLDGWNDIPYLNGGLFERDEQDKPKSKFPAQMFKNLFDFYSRYNFTIYENDPDDAEVGIDPEMLGHIFENLLEDNKDKGAFYTPKEIVQYMSRESIAQYLKTHADEALHTAIDELIKDGKVGEALQDKANATAIYRLLCDVKVCDPAIGSGAFPMGVLNVLYHARMLLYAFTRPTQGFSPAMVKREIIQNNIYGVDIEKGAVDIARLRFWLALVVDEEEPQPLPNLDYKIMCGNSLIHRFALDAPFKDVLKHYNKENKTNFTLDDYRQWVYDYTNLSDHTQKDNFRQKIEEIKSAFKTELSKGEKLKLSDVRGEIDNLQAKDIFGKQVGSATEIKKMQKKLKDLEAQRDDINNNKLYENAFEWRFEFPALLDDNGNFTGFDVVIGNPPYGAKLSESEKKLLKRIFFSAQTGNSLKGSLDTFSLFIELGYNISVNKGFASFIVPLSITASDAMSSLHKLLTDNCKNIFISSYGDRPKRIFESAEQQVSIISYQKTGSIVENLMTTHINKRYSNDSLWLLLDNLQFVNAKSLTSFGRIPKIGTEIEKNILRKLLGIKTKLVDIYNENGSRVYYRKAGGRYYKIITTKATESSAEGYIEVESEYQKVVAAILSSDLYYWFWLIHSDWHNLRTSELEMMPFPIEKLNKDAIKQITIAYDNYQKDLYDKCKYTKTGLQTFTARQSRSYIKKLDELICPLYGLNSDEIDFIMNFELEFRATDE
jgi:hypothetical protein